MKQTEAIAGAAAVDPTAAGRLLESAKGKGLRELQDECRATRTNADPDPEATRARIHAKRSYRTWTDADGTGHLHLSGPSDVIARLDNAVRHRCDRIFRDARRDGRREPTDAYAFDAAAELLTSGGDGTPVPAGADAKIIVRVDLAGPAPRPGASTGRPVRSPGSARSPCRSCGSGWTTPSSPPSSPRAPRSPRSCTSAAGSPASSAPPSSGGTRSAPARAATTASASSTTTSRTGPTPTPPASSAGRRFCPPCHRLKTLGWHVSEPDADGQCTFTPPPTGDPSRPGDPTVVHELAEATQAALRARRGALARS